MLIACSMVTLPSQEADIKLGPGIIVVIVGSRHVVFFLMVIGIKTTFSSIASSVAFIFITKVHMSRINTAGRGASEKPYYLLFFVVIFYK